MQKETEKHTQIMQAAAGLFARFGYKKTTVDEIVAVSGISKGLFYHYFTNKKDLYLQLYDAYVELLKNSITEKVNTEETDFLERLKQISHIRIDFINCYPDLWGFLYSAYYEQDPEVAPSVKNKNKMLLQNSGVGSAVNIDWSRLNKQLTPDEAINLITWIAEGFVRQVNAGQLQLDKKLYLEFDKYLELLRTGIYDQGGQ